MSESYTSLLEQCVSRGKPARFRRIANNTYVERLFRDENGVWTPVEPSVVPPEAVGVRLHNTHVLIYTRDDQVIFNTGGWKTVTTKERLHTFGPAGVHVFSQRGDWYLGRWKEGHDRDTLAFRDGITLRRVNDDWWNPVEGTYVTEDQLVTLRAAQKAFDKQLTAFLAHVREQTVPQWQAQIREDSTKLGGGDCFYCQHLVKDQHGAVIDDTDHLWNHLRENYCPVRLAARATNDGRFGIWVQFFPERIIKCLRDYLRDKLRPAPESLVPKPASPFEAPEEWVGHAKSVLERPSDFGYFGNDERLWVSSAPTWGRNRDSDALERSNFDAVWNALNEAFPNLISESAERRSDDDESLESIYVFNSGHWAVGWIDQIVVPVLADPQQPLSATNLHPAFHLVCESADAHRSYPVLDESRYSELQHEEFVAYIKDCATEELTEEQLGKVIEYLHNNDAYTEEDLSNEVLVAALRTVNVEPVSWLLPLEERV